MSKVNITFNFQNRVVNLILNEEEAFNLLRSALGFENLEESSSGKALSTPESSDIFDFIKSKPNYNFSFEEIAEQYIDEDLNVDEYEKKKWDNALRAKINRIKNKIAEDEGGKWEVKKDGFKRMYKFVKNTSIDDPKVTNELNDALEEWR